MNLSNKYISPIIKILYLILISLILIPLVIIIFFPFNPFKEYFIIIFSVIVLYIFILKILGLPYFSYESNGETINVFNKKYDLFFGTNMKAINRAEFPKRKLHKFKIKSFLLYRRLDLFLDSKQASNGISKLSYHISYLNNSDIKNLRKSLNKIIEENKLNKEKHTNN